MEPEVVRPVDGEPVTLRPCPPWCTQTRHFADSEAVYADHGYHHCGCEVEVPISHPFLGLANGDPTIVRAILKSWTHPLDADPGPSLIELNLGTATERTDLCAEATPAEARAIAQALLDLADTAEQGGRPGASSQPTTSRKGTAMPKRASDEELLAGILQARIERWLEQEGVFHVAGFGDVALAGELDWEPGAGPVFLRRLGDGQLWRADITITARPAEPGEPGTHLQ
jgi:Domain of unknown function (DUF6907)